MAPLRRSNRSSTSSEPKFTTPQKKITPKESTTPKTSKNTTTPKKSATPKTPKKLTTPKTPKKTTTPKKPTTPKTRKGKAMVAKSMLNQLLEVVTSMTEGMECEGENADHLVEILPDDLDLQINGIKAAADMRSQLADGAGGRMTRARHGAVKKLLEIIPTKMCLARPDPDVKAVLQLPNRQQNDMLKRRYQAEIGQILKKENPFMHKFCKPDVEPVILNVVASACMDMNTPIKLDLKKIGQLCSNVEYNPNRFAPCVMRIKDPKCTALIFSSGRMVVSGCKSEKECKKAFRVFARHIQQRLNLDPEIYIVNFQIQNISANVALRWPVRIKAMAEDKLAKKFVSFESELFPGLVFSLAAPRCKIVIFATGGLLMTGLKSEKDLKYAMETIYPICRQFRHY